MRRSQYQAIILAAGRGSRMHSDCHKSLHQIAGKPIIDWQLRALKQSGVAAIQLVVGYQSESVIRHVAHHHGVRWAVQDKQLGTGDATSVGLQGLNPHQPVIVLAGDIPFIGSATIQRACAQAAQGALALVTTRLDNPTGYGRVVCDPADSDQVVAIVEEADADAATRQIDRVYCGVLAATVPQLTSWLAGLDTNNQQGEYYLPAVVPAAIADGTPVVCVPSDNQVEVTGVNSLAQLIQLERQWYYRLAEAHIARGVYIADPHRFDLPGELLCGKGVRIAPGCTFSGTVELHDGVEIGSCSVLADCTIGAGSRVEAFCHITGAEVADSCTVGPYARLRTGSSLHSNSKVGNFVEMKNASLGTGSKANHLSYIGDTSVDTDTNIGAGTITCNYDGTSKHHTRLGKNVFVGSNSSLVAPLRIGDGTIIAAGSVITEDVPDQSLSFGRSRQTNKPRGG